MKTEINFRGVDLEVEYEIMGHCEATREEPSEGGYADAYDILIDDVSISSWLADDIVFQIQEVVYAKVSGKI